MHEMRGQLHDLRGSGGLLVPGAAAGGPQCAPLPPVVHGIFHRGGWGRRLPAYCVLQQVRVPRDFSHRQPCSRVPPGPGRQGRAPRPVQESGSAGGEDAAPQQEGNRALRPQTAAEGHRRRRRRAASAGSRGHPEWAVLPPEPRQHRAGKKHLFFQLCVLRVLHLFGRLAAGSGCRTASIGNGIVVKAGRPAECEALHFLGGRRACGLLNRQATA